MDKMYVESLDKAFSILKKNTSREEFDRIVDGMQPDKDGDRVLGYDVIKIIDLFISDWDKKIEEDMNIMGYLIRFKYEVSGPDKQFN